MKKINILNYFVIAFSAIVYISLIFTDSIWSDEAFTMQIIKYDYLDIIYLTAMDVHPPLYYLIAKTFTVLFGYSVPVVKMVSILPVLLIMLIVTRKSNKLFKTENSAQISLIFNLLISFLPVAFNENIELRMYTWSMFFVACSGIYAYEIFKNRNKKNIVIFLLSSLCATYTHYFAAISVFVIYLILFICLIKKDKKNLSFCMILADITIIGYLPWLPVLWNQIVSVKNDFWISGINILNDIKFLFSGQFTYIFIILFAIILIGFLINLVKSKKDEETYFAIFSISVIIITVLIGYILSSIIRPIFIDRYMYGAVGLFVLGISIAITKLKYKKIIYILLIGLIIINFPFSYMNTFKQEYINGTEDFKKFEKENFNENDVFTTDIIDLTWKELQYYLPYNKLYYGIDEYTTGYVITGMDLDSLKEVIPNRDIIKIFEGDIDNRYKFSIYYVSNADKTQ